MKILIEGLHIRQVTIAKKLPEDKSNLNAYYQGKRAAGDNFWKKLETHYSEQLAKIDVMLKNAVDAIDHITSSNTVEEGEETYGMETNKEIKRLKEEKILLTKENDYLREDILAALKLLLQQQGLSVPPQKGKKP